MPDSTAECSSCHAPVYWCVKDPLDLNERGLPKVIPVDVASVGAADGKVEVWSEPIVPVPPDSAAYVLKFRYLNRSHPAPDEGHKRATSHFATCPDRKEWRRS